MKTLDTQWIEELRRQTAEDILAFRSTLPPDERALLDEYHHLQKQMEVCLTRMAYNAGVSHGHKLSKHS